MTRDLPNVYDDMARADSYDKLEFPGTYYLAYRDLPKVLGEHVRGKRALDFGCGTGRSTRFLQGLGYHATGVDIAGEMLEHARERDPRGDYRLVPDAGEGELGDFEAGSFDLVLSVFTFDNIPTLDRKETLFRSLRDLLRPDGRIVCLVSTPEIYQNEWASFSTKDFPENLTAKSGDRVRIIMLDVDDRRPVEDVVCSHEDYLEVYRRSGLTPVRVRRPLGHEDEEPAWVSETSVAPWAIYVLSPTPAPDHRPAEGEADAAGSGVSIRPARAEDVARLPEVERSAAGLYATVLEETGLTPKILGRTTTPEDFERARRAGHLWVAVDTSDIAVGFALLIELGGTAHLEEIDVLPGFARRGVGSALVERVCEWSATTGHSHVTLSTYRDVPWNAPFYARRGFEIVDPADVSAAHVALVEAESARGLVTERRVIMRRRLDAASRP